MLSARPLEIVTEDGACIGRLEEIMLSSEQRALLKLELAVVVITARPLVQATYTMEHDGPTTLIAYDLIQTVNSWFSLHMPALTFPGLSQAMNECAVALHVPLANIEASISSQCMLTLSVVYSAC